MYLAIKMIICMYLCIHQLNVFANIQVNAIFKHLDRKKRDSRINFRIFRFACNVCMYIMVWFTIFIHNSSQWTHESLLVYIVGILLQDNWFIYRGDIFDCLSLYGF